MTPLEKRALYGLVIGVVWAIAFFGVFVMLGGVSAFREDEVLRGIMFAIAGVGCVASIILRISYRKSLVDERDRRIMSRASETEVTAILFAVVIWCAALGLIYGKEGLMSAVHLFLLVIAVFVVSMLGEAIGILLWSRFTEILRE